MGQRQGCGSWQGVGATKGISQHFISVGMARTDTGLLQLQAGRSSLA